MSQQSNPPPGEAPMQVHIPQELEYVYRDVVNIHVGSGEVIMEFGNRHRSPPGHASLGNRIVLSVENAYRLHQELGASLSEARKSLLGDQNGQGKG